MRQDDEIQPVPATPAKADLAQPREEYVPIVVQPAPRKRGLLWVLRGMAGLGFMLGQVAAAAWAIAWLLGADATSSHWLRQHRPETAVFVLAFVVIYAWAYWLEEPR